MIQFKEDEVCRLMRAVTHYRDTITGCDETWDRYNDLVKKIYCYGEDASPTQVDCENK